jgi:hypothetical protein
VIFYRVLMSIDHAERLARWKQREKESSMQRIRLDIDRIVTKIDFTMYGTIAEPEQKGRVRLSARTKKRGGE